MKTLAITPHTTTADLFKALAAILLLLASRVYDDTAKVFRAVYRWATTEQDFLGEDGEPIRCTGARFALYALSFFALMCLMCINF